jgi:hypothetical protein
MVLSSFITARRRAYSIRLARSARLRSCMARFARRRACSTRSARSARLRLCTARFARRRVHRPVQSIQLASGHVRLASLAGGPVKPVLLAPLASGNVRLASLVAVPAGLFNLFSSLRSPPVCMALFARRPSFQPVPLASVHMQLASVAGGTVQPIRLAPIASEHKQLALLAPKYLWMSGLRAFGTLSLQPRFIFPLIPSF